ncbi:hypothetical protein OAD49_05300 [Flavobacteriaceae bacterium]|nr:hypothetical protein [Flavobacteriaceae bacterium]
MEKIKLGYILLIGGILNVIFALFDTAFLAIVTFIAAIACGVYLLVNEETAVKIAFEKVKSYKIKDSTISTISAQEKSNSIFLPVTKPNYFALGACGVAIISLFLPWIKASASVSGAGIGYSSSSVNLSGIVVDTGIPLLLLSVFTLIMCYKRFKYSSALGLLMLLIGLSLILIYEGSGSSYSASSGGYSSSARSSLKVEFGWLVFLAASLIVTISTVKDFIIALRK